MRPVTKRFRGVVGLLEDYAAPGVPGVDVVVSYGLDAGAGEVGVVLGVADVIE